MQGNEGIFFSPPAGHLLNIRGFRDFRRYAIIDSRQNQCEVKNNRMARKLYGENEQQNKYD
jgi:hypothetical protein